jgi:hypothetical protein
MREKSMIPKSPVYNIAASVAAGLPRERIRSAYPGIDDRLIELAAIHAEATPWRPAATARRQGNESRLR